MLRTHVHHVACSPTSLPLPPPALPASGGTANPVRPAAPLSRRQWWVQSGWMPLMRSAGSACGRWVQCSVCFESRALKCCLRKLSYFCAAGAFVSLSHVLEVCSALCRNMACWFGVILVLHLWLALDAHSRGLHARIMHMRIVRGGCGVDHQPTACGLWDAHATMPLYMCMCTVVAHVLWQ